MKSVCIVISLVFSIINYNMEMYEKLFIMFNGCFNIYL